MEFEKKNPDLEKWNSELFEILLELELEVKEMSWNFKVKHTAKNKPMQIIHSDLFCIKLAKIVSSMPEVR